MFGYQRNERSVKWDTYCRIEDLMMIPTSEKINLDTKI